MTSSTYTVEVTRASAADFAQTVYVKASNNIGAADHFGSSMAFDGDTLVVGAPLRGSGAGGVYVFVREGGAWSEQAFLQADNGESGDVFGHSVAISGDTIAVGAILEDGGSAGVDGADNNDEPESGSVYVFTRSGASWSQQAYLKASNVEGGDQFGFSVAVSGDTLAVGAIGEESAATGIGGAEDDNTATPAAGAVYVFRRTGTDWAQDAYVKASNTDAADHFGRSVALDGDALAVGAYREASNDSGVDAIQDNDEAPDSGAVYVFSRSSGAWLQDEYIKASNAEGGDQFGYSVALSGDTLAVGAWKERSAGAQTNNDAVGAGAAYVFIRNGTTWSQEGYLNGDQTPNPVIDSGAVYIFR
jgi:hypothetical protein